MTVKKIFIISFVSTLLLPFSVSFLYQNNLSHENTNNDNTTKFTETSIIKYLKHQKENLESNFALRDIFIKSYLYIKQNILQAEALPYEVKKGKDGWLFLGNSYKSVFNESLGAINHDSKSIDEICSKIEKMNSICSQNNADFYFAIVSNKHTIYADKLPLTPIKSKSRFAQVKHKINNDSIVKFIDLSEDFNLYKDSTKLYHKTDSHWTSYGALLGTKKLLQTLSQTYNINADLCKFKNYKIDSILIEQMDLCRLTYQSTPEYQYVFTPVKPELKVNEPVNNMYKHNTTNNLKILIFHDSYFLSMKSFLPPYFDELHFFWSGFDVIKIKQIKPDIVIFLSIERSLADFESKKMVF
ncbi:alginate O-acetyltransferase AlgX-related protein [Plebeiibacterium marinum]|uniref:AlgX/AlgJ SGNH hydrolase-like domain-containing protein n=1 Tax=Plebeiibacterium marinum TaxID=2992111 RepID=A0AAE3SLF0_9BACT|nr:hypothetical protein [Plebeiobacterium marinum]MCW3807384.1 hypothetical protein [Plebeiobacterium marinum]